MRFDDNTRTRLLVTETMSFDPSAATIEVKVDSTWYPADWLGTASSSNGKWTREARTAGYFAGPGVTSPAGAVVLTAGRHATETRITNGGDIIVQPSTSIDVT